MWYWILSSGKLPIQVDDDDDIQRAISTTGHELPQPEEVKISTTNYNKQDESAPPLPPKPPAEWVILILFLITIDNKGIGLH